MKSILKYSTEIDWDYNLKSDKSLKKKFFNVRTKSNSGFDKQKKSKYQTGSNQFSFDLVDNKYINNRKNHTKSYHIDSRSGSKKLPSTSFIYYGILFTLIFGFLFFLSISISFASPIKEKNYSESNIYDTDHSTKLLENYIFQNDKTNQTDNHRESPLTSKVTFFNYRVKKNESYESIAKKLGISIDTIYLVNDIKKKSVLRAGRILVIPNQDGRVISVKKNDSIFKIASRYGIRWEKIADANNLDSSVIYSGMNLFIPGSAMTTYEKKQFDIINYIWPVRGRINSPFGSRIDPITGVYSFHSGIDIKSKRGTPVKLFADGKVIYTGWQKVYGNFVMIRHDNNLISIYAHLDTISVEKNQTLSQGEYLGKVGSTGRSTGPHLHFELRKNGKLIDPLKYLP